MTTTKKATRTADDNDKEGDEDSRGRNDEEGDEDVRGQRRRRRRAWH